MFGFIFKKIFGSKNDRYLRRLRPIVARINALEPQMQELADEDFAQRMAEYRQQVQAGERTLDDLLPEVFALVREASRRVMGMRHYDVQLVGGIVLHRGKIAEMKTGEGKTLVATLPVALNALSGKGVHVVTVNDYLATRDAQWMGKLYNFLGLSVGVIVNGLDDQARKEAYGADITYGTNNEFGFDYLRDNMKFYATQLVQRGHNFAIVDEVDSILIDEARTPLIISGASDESVGMYRAMDQIVRQLGPEAVRILPGVSSLQQACARLGLPWHDVICLSLHGRDDLTPLHTAVHRQRPISLLTDARMTPDLLARHLLDRGVDWFAMHVFEHMGSDGAQEHHLTLAEAAAARFGAVCTVLLTPAGEMRRPHPGLLPAELRHEDGLLTKPAVRAAALALLRPEPRHTVWDLGAGSGSVALEAACLAHEGRVVAVERTPSRALDIQENRRRFGAASVDVCLGTVPQCLPRLPDPHRVFIGGGLSGDGAHNLLEQVCRRLLPGGRLVVSCILLDTLARCRAFFEGPGWPAEVMQIQSAQSRPLGQDIFLAAANPVFLLAVDKPEQEKDED